jgi:predicted metal-dependent phosphoesterase TrpH
MEAAMEKVQEPTDGGVRLSVIANTLVLSCLAPPADDCEVSTGFASDVPSEVLARAPRGGILVTSQSSLNMLAVATYTGLAGVIVTSGQEPVAEVLVRAREEGIGLYATAAQTFDVVGKLAGLGLTGPRGRSVSRKGKTPSGERGSGMRIYTADMHIHTKLSPCGSEEMTPRRIAAAACAAGLEIIAICDHNSCRNAAAVMEAARPLALTVIPGIEIETKERIHVVGLFPDMARAQQVSDTIGRTLPETDEAYIAHIGEQILLDADGSALGTETKALASPSAFDLPAVVRLIKENGGLAVAAHVERRSFSVYSQLGDVPRNVPFDALEVSPVNHRPIGLREKFARYGWPLVASSDSHYLSELGRARSWFLMEAPTFAEISLALHGLDGRNVSYA